MRNKSPSELNTKTVRIDIGDYVLLKELSDRFDVTVAEALRMLLHIQAQETWTREPKTQLPMPIFSVLPRPSALVVNGNKQVALRIEPRGGVIYE